VYLQLSGNPVVPNLRSPLISEWGQVLFDQEAGLGDDKARHCYLHRTLDFLTVHLLHGGSSNDAHFTHEV
jgi:hypothetical protein